MPQHPGKDFNGGETLPCRTTPLSKVLQRATTLSREARGKWRHNLGKCSVLMPGLTRWCSRVGVCEVSWNCESVVFDIAFLSNNSKCYCLQISPLRKQKSAAKMPSKQKIAPHLIAIITTQCLSCNVTLSTRANHPTSQLYLSGFTTTTANGSVLYHIDSPCKASPPVNPPTFPPSLIWPWWDPDSVWKHIKVAQQCQQES